MDFKNSSSDSNLFQLFQDSRAYIPNEEPRSVYYILL